MKVSNVEFEVKFESSEVVGVFADSNKAHEFMLNNSLNDDVKKYPQLYNWRKEIHDVIGAPAFKFQLAYDPSGNFSGSVTMSGLFDTPELAYKHVREQLPENIQKYFKVVAVVYLEKDVNDFMFRGEL